MLSLELVYDLRRFSNSFKSVLERRRKKHLHLLEGHSGGSLARKGNDFSEATSLFRLDVRNKNKYTLKLLFNHLFLTGNKLFRIWLLLKEQLSCLRFRIFDLLMDIKTGTGS